MAGARAPWWLRAPVVIFGAALIVRVLYVVSIRHAVFFDHLQTEPQHYDAWARAILDGTAGVKLPFDEAPAYPYFVAWIYALAGPSVMAVCVVQAVLGAAGCAAIACVAARVAGARGGWIAGGIGAVYAPLIYFTGQLEPAALAAAAVAGALAATPFEPDATARRWYVAAAAWTGVIVVRSEFVLAVPVLIAHAWLVAGRARAWRVACVPAALLVLSLGANVIASGHPVVLTVGSGVNLWLGNNAEADGVNPFVHGALRPVADEIDHAAHDAAEADALFRARAVAFVGAEPGREVALLARKFAWTFSHRELPNAADIPWQTDQSWLFVPPVFPLGFGLLFPLACAGAALLGRTWKQRAILAAPIVVVVAACTLMFTNARFRLPMIPALIVLAAVAIDPAIVRARARLGRAALAAAIGAALAWVNFAGVAHYRIAEIDANTGFLEHAAGHLDRAEKYLRAALAKDPSDGQAWAELVAVLREAGKTEAAKAAMADAERHLVR